MHTFDWKFGFSALKRLKTHEKRSSCVAYPAFGTIFLLGFPVRRGFGGVAAVLGNVA